MSNLHVLSRPGPGRATVAMHVAVPSGNNGAALLWKTVLLAAGKAGTTALTEGTGPGQISTAEKATVISGDVLEFIATISVSDVGSNAQRLAALDEIYTAATADLLTQLQYAYNYYGLTRG